MADVGQSERSRASGVDAFFGVLALFSLALLVLSASYDWGGGWTGLFTFLAGLGFGWCLARGGRRWAS